MRSVGISVFSLVLTTVVVANAYYQKKQFYPSVVYITKSNPSMAVIYIQAFICIWIAGKIMRKIFFGQLRTTEFEHLMERSWYAITETCLAFTVFRDDFNPKFVALFTLLLFLKSFHWLAEDRVDFMERSPVISWIYHIRVISLLLLLGSMDLYFLQHAYQSTISKGASVQLVFGFEYAILITVVFNIALKYGLHVIDLRTETPWENKAVFLLYIELVMGFIKVLLYIAFVAIMVRIYTLPLFAFRPMYYTIRNFKKAFTDVILSRRAIHNMNTQYPDITAEELAAAADTVCIICREEMTTASKKLPCNHMFHTSCLRSWFQRQQTCPTCRLDILFTNNNATRNRRARPQVQPVAPNQQQQPPQQQPQVAQPQFLNPIFAAAALFNNPGVNNNQMPPVNNGQVPNLGAAAGEQAHLPPLAFPPFPFLPFMTPPPMPAQNLRALSPEELHRLEGNERLNVEARIQCLRNIQIMLDAAVVMMQQYSAASAFSSQMPGPTEAPSSSDTANHNSSAAAATTTSVETNTDSTAAAANIEEPSSSTTCNNVSKTEIDQASIATTSSTANEQVQNNLLNTPDEVRRRRLEKFQQNAEQQ